VEECEGKKSRVQEGDGALFICRRDEGANVQPIKQRGGCAMPEMGVPPNPAGATACSRLQY